ncbi:MAG: triose-phosphate isomerase [Candidatus Saccharibacteria bacterium]|nr:triose-phosphate isomerase [Candidatus Saccharibacteria bacterium]
MKSYIVGNWKLNFTVGEASIYLHKLLKKLPNYRDIDVIVAPPTVALQPLSLQVDRHKIKLAAQNAFYRDYGAFTGETSFTQLNGLVDYCIIGHSERRYIFREDSKMIANKVAAAIRNKIRPILCIGETESERSFGETADVIRDQLLSGLREIDAEDVSKVLVAYEPVWAISSAKGAKLASPDEIADVIRLIREILTEVYGGETAEKTPILFGGSVNPSNAGAYLTIPGVNGLLAGGASLILGEFADIIEVAKRVRS